MNINIYEMIPGAREARGLTVVIDVFRAFSLECWLFDAGVKEIYPVGDLSEAFRMKEEHPDWLLFGERGGAKVDGCDFGNSPSSVEGADLAGRTVIHTSGAGTQGIANAVHADEIITGSLVNAKAVARYIKSRNPDTVSFAAMGKAGIASAREDVICAEYIRSLLTGEDYDIDEKIKSLRHDGGEHFFDPDRQSVFPSADFYMCIKRDFFPFVISSHKLGGVVVNRRYDFS